MMGQHTVQPGGTLTINPTVTGTPPYAFSLGGIVPSWASINAQTGVITANVPASAMDGQSFAFTLEAAGCNGSQDSEPVVINVVQDSNCVPVVINDPNPGGCNPPVFNAPASATVAAGGSTSVNLGVTGDATIAYQTNQTWATVSGGILQINAASLSAGSQSVTITATNSCNSATLTLPVTIGAGGGGDCVVAINDQVSGTSHQIDVSMSQGACNAGDGYQVYIASSAAGAFFDNWVAPVTVNPAGGYTFDHAALADGTYVIRAICNDGGACNQVEGSQQFTVSAGGGGGGGDCTVAISNAPASATAGATISYDLAMSAGDCSGAGGYQTWLTAQADPGPNGDGFIVAGSGDATRSLTIPAGLADGTYYIWAKCNDAGACQNAYSVVPITIGAGGGGGGGGGTCALNVATSLSGAVRTINLSMSSGACAGNYQVYITTIGADGSANFYDDFLIAPTPSGAGTYVINESLLTANGNYLIRARCNDGGTCQNTEGQTSFTGGVTGGGGGGGTCPGTFDIVNQAISGDTLNFQVNGLNGATCNNLAVWISTANSGADFSNQLVGVTYDGGSNSYNANLNGQAAGTYFMRAVCRDGGVCDGSEVTESFQWTGNGGGCTLSVTPSSFTVSGTEGTALGGFSVRVNAAVAGVAPILTATDLPAGLNVSAPVVTGGGSGPFDLTWQVTGTPTTAGTFNTLFSSLAGACTGSQQVPFNIASSGGGGGGVSITSPATANYVQNDSVSFDIQVTSGATVTAAGLPASLGLIQINATTWRVQGTASNPGTATVVFTASLGGQTAQDQTVITIQ